MTTNKLFAGKKMKSSSLGFSSESRHVNVNATQKSKVEEEVIVDENPFIFETQMIHCNRKCLIGCSLLMLLSFSSLSILLWYLLSA